MTATEILSRIAVQVVFWSFIIWAYRRHVRKLSFQKRMFSAGPILAYYALSGISLVISAAFIYFYFNFTTQRSDFEEQRAAVGFLAIMFGFLGSIQPILFFMHGHTQFSWGSERIIVQKRYNKRMIFLNQVQEVTLKIWGEEILLHSGEKIPVHFVRPNELYFVEWLRTKIERRKKRHLTLRSWRRHRPRPWVRRARIAHRWHRRQ